MTEPEPAPSRSIITVTANPMVEHVFFVPDLQVGEAHLPALGHAYASGKAINVSRALHCLGTATLAVVATGGERGKEVEARLKGESIPAHVVPVSGETRIGFITYHQGLVTTIYGPGPTLTEADVDRIVNAVAALLPAEVLVIAGSVGHPALYPRLARLPATLVLDVAHSCLRECLEGAQELLLAKPNRQECRLFLGQDDPVRAAALLADQGAIWAVVTDAAGPAIFRHQGTTWRVYPPAVPQVHPVGCGDALCAGLLHARHQEPEKAVAFAMACGAHNASRAEIGRLDPAACEALAKTVVLEKLSG